MSGIQGKVDAYGRAYYERDIQSATTWMGTKVCKFPGDLWAVQEIIVETRPTLIVETGTFHGGSALFYAHLFDALGAGQVTTIDLVHDDVPPVRPAHPRIHYITGCSSIDKFVMEIVREEAKGKRTMVILDSAHDCDHVLQELRAYAPLVSFGCYLVVEDTNPLAYRVMGLTGPGPREALKAFQPSNHGFEVDRAREKFLFSFHPAGWFKRVR